MERTYLRIGIIPLAGMLALATVGCPWELGPAPPTYTVHGTAAGITEPISVRLAHDLGEVLLTIRSDGPFVFEALLHEGEAYAVSLVGSPPCEIVGAMGVAGDSDPDVAVQCGAALVSLSSLSLRGAVPALDFSPGQLEYAVDVPGFQQSIAVLARTANPSATIRLNGKLVTSEEPVPIRLPVGEGDIEIAIAHPQGLQRSYRISARRAAKLAQHAYVKASNGREYDEFGVCMAMDGNLLAVGAIGEDSAATGIDGDQQNQGASFSGAVYVFRRDGISWTQEAYLKASNTGAEDGFGCGIALSGDTLAVGAAIP